MAEDTAVHGETHETDSKATPRAPDREPVQRGQTGAGRLASAAIVAVAAILTALVIMETTRYPRTDDAEVFANYIGIAPVVDGPITEISVHDNQFVRAGELLFRIDDRPYRYALEQARSGKLALQGQIVDQTRQIHAEQSAATAAQAATETARANVGRAAGAVDQADADLANARAARDHAQAIYDYSLANLHRIEPLLAKQFVTADQVDQLRTGTAGNLLLVRQADAQIHAAEAELASSQAALAASQSGVFQSRAQRRQSQSSVTTLEPLTGQIGARESNIETAAYNLDHCQVQAPFDARVTNLTLSPGAYARAGVQVFTLIDTRVWWVIANFRETQLPHIQPGMHVTIFLLQEPDKLYRGVVESTSFGVTPDASTIGVLGQGLPDAQRTLSWVHLASRYPVRIRILNPAPGSLRIAESATVVVRGWSGW